MVKGKLSVIGAPDRILNPCYRRERAYSALSRTARLITEEITAFVLDWRNISMSKGFYSHFDPTGEQATFNNRRRLKLGADGRYAFTSIMPGGYSVPPGARPTTQVTCFPWYSRTSIMTAERDAAAQTIAITSKPICRRISIMGLVRVYAKAMRRSSLNVACKIALALNLHITH
jgi:Dioxygenase